MAEISYADNYEEITGKKIPVVETKVVGAPVVQNPEPAVIAETA